MGWPNGDRRSFHASALVYAPLSKHAAQDECVQGIVDVPEGPARDQQVRPVKGTTTVVVCGADIAWRSAHKQSKGEEKNLSAHHYVSPSSCLCIVKGRIHLPNVCTFASRREPPYFLIKMHHDLSTARVVIKNNYDCVQERGVHGSRIRS